MTDESSDTSKHVKIFILADGTGLVDQEKSMEFFNQTLQNYTNRYNSMVEALRPAIKQTLDADNTDFMSVDDLKYSARKILAEQGFDIAPEELSDLIDVFNKNHYIATRRGRSGGVQMFDTAVNILARRESKGAEVTEVLIESIKLRLLQDL